MILALLLALHAQDPGLSSDKTLHFGVTAAVSAGGYAIGAELGAELPRFLVGAALGLGAAAGKEVLDFAGGEPSWGDFVAGALGTAAGLLAAWMIDHFFREPVLPFWLTPTD